MANTNLCVGELGQISHMVHQQERCAYQALGAAAGAFLVLALKAEETQADMGMYGNAETESEWPR